MKMAKTAKLQRTQPNLKSGLKIVAMANGQLIDISTVNDPLFAGKALGESAAFRYEGDEVTVCSPASGELKVVFPNEHAFGVTMAEGVELLVHIGINTIEADGRGFTFLKKQGDRVRAGEEVVRVNLKQLSEKYDLSTMLIVTNANGKTISFIDPCNVTKGMSVVR